VVAKARKVRPSVLLREALDQVLAGHDPEGGTSCYDLCSDLFERIEPGGPKDLSTNKKYMDGFGKRVRLFLPTAIWETDHPDLVPDF